MSAKERERERARESERGLSQDIERGSERECERGSTSCANFRYVCVLERAQTRAPSDGAVVVVGCTRARPLFAYVSECLCASTCTRVCMCVCTVHSVQLILTMGHVEQ